MNTPFGRTYWEEQAKEAWMELGNPPPSISDPFYDAFRHAYTGAIWTASYGEMIARKGGDYIEQSRKDNFTKGDPQLRDVRGDLTNNDKGREIGKNTPLPKNSPPGTIRKIIAQEVSKAIGRGELVTSPQTDPRTTRENFPSRLRIKELDDDYYEYYRRPEFNKEFRRGVNWTQPSDPLVLDLDGDGIELTSSDSTVLFDHNADDVKTGTQWARPDDGMLVRDINGNGVIDSSRELFGDQTLLPNGQLATNGFAALAALDNTHDAVINASDGAFAEFKLWRDVNQDGVSQANELQSLSEAGITSINIPINLAQPTSTFVKTSADGTTSTVQAVRNVNFTTNGFYSEFINHPVITATAAALPQMQGSGLVRDLREAMSLGTAQSQALEQTLNAFKAATSTQARQTLLNTVVNAWANTSALSAALARNPIPGNPSNWYLEFPDKQQTGERQ